MAARVRVADRGYVPVWDKGYLNLARAFARKNVWRVAPHHDTDDLVQEAYLRFVRVSEEYRNQRLTRLQFKTLFRAALTYRIYDLARWKMHRATTFGAPDPELIQSTHQGIDVLALDLQEAPEEVRDLFQGIRFSCPSTFPPRRRRGRRETRGERLVRLAGVSCDPVEFREVVERWVKSFLGKSD